MRIGLDFDNTIVCYDEAFYQLAHEDKGLPPDLPHTKEHVRAHFQKLDQNDYWTALQGLAYGPHMEKASAFPGFTEFLAEALKHHDVFIISHRSPKPYSGLDYDLHAAGKAWLKNRPWVGTEQSVDQIAENNIFFESTKQDKVKRVADLEIDFFVDDLPEILNHPDFPQKTRKVLFEKNWPEILGMLKKL